MFGTSEPSFAVGEADAVSVVADHYFKNRYEDSFTVVVRNNTDSPIADLELGMLIRDGSGSPIGSMTADGFVPVVVQPGHIAWATAHNYDEVEVNPEDYQIQYTPDYAEGSSRFSYRPLSIDEIAFRDDGIVAVITNQHNENARSVKLSFLCLDADGTPLYSSWAFADPSELDADQTTSASYGFRYECPVVLATASGRIG